MTSSAATFAGSIPLIYHQNLESFIFEPFAADMAARVEALEPSRILETAAGTGIVTSAMSAALPAARIVATDLNERMLQVASARPGLEAVIFEQADAQSLPFPDSSFDVVVCQFGVMFFPDRVGAYREAIRVLRPAGTFLFSVWSSILDNPVTAAVAAAAAAVFPENPPSFFQRMPFGYHDPESIRRELAAAGFQRVDIEQVEKTSWTDSPESAALGLCEGTPLRNEIAERNSDRLEDVTAAATAALKALAEGGKLVSRMSAYVVTATVDPDI